MKANKATQQALIAMLNRIYGEIYAIEQAWDIRGDSADYRPRIDYFHDAIRAFTSGAPGARLSVEFLSYDISMLRYIQANPLARPKGSKPQGSPGTALIAGNEKPTSTSKMNASLRQNLVELYKSYSVLFAALLADTADHDYQSRINETTNEKDTLADLEQTARNLPKNEQLIDIHYFLDQEVEDPDLEAKLRQFLQASKRKKMQASEAIREFKGLITTLDTQIKAIEKAHFTFVTSQLLVYENARDVVKKMATQGMNIVGSFVETAVQEASRGQRSR